MATLRELFRYNNRGANSATYVAGEGKIQNLFADQFYHAGDVTLSPAVGEFVTITIDLDEPCEFREDGTLTPGYWKTHSAEGPAPFDDTWNALANGEDTPFFGSGKTYYQALWTAPSGNAYYILAHAYIAAQLNILNGASVPANVQTAFNTATALFVPHTPAQIAAL